MLIYDGVPETNIPKLKKNKKKMLIHDGVYCSYRNLNVRKMSVSQVAACLDEEDLRDAAESDEAELVDVPRVDRKKDTRIDTILKAALDEEERLDELDELTTVPDDDAAHVAVSAEASLEREHGREDVETVSNGPFDRSREESWEESWDRYDTKRAAYLAALADGSCPLTPEETYEEWYVRREEMIQEERISDL